MIHSKNISEHILFKNHPQSWEFIAPYIRMRIRGKDEVLLHHGDLANSLFFVQKGWVKLTRQTPDGKETIIGLCTAGDIFGEAALFAHANYPYHAEVVALDTEIALIPAEIIREVLKKDEKFSSRIMSLLNERVAQTQLKLEHMNTMSSAQRLGCFLLRLCNYNENNQQTLQIPIEKHLLAAYLGMKPETLSRSQQQLKTVGVNVQGTQVNVLNIESLRNFVCNSCSESGSCEVEEIAF